LHRVLARWVDSGVAGFVSDCGAFGGIESGEGSIDSALVLVEIMPMEFVAGAVAYALIIAVTIFQLRGRVRG
jgi:hypothetical protein